MGLELLGLWIRPNWQTLQFVSVVTSQQNIQSNRRLIILFVFWQHIEVCGCALLVTKSDGAISKNSWHCLHQLLCTQILFTWHSFCSCKKQPSGDGGWDTGGCGTGFQHRFQWRGWSPREHYQSNVDPCPVLTLPTTKKKHTCKLALAWPSIIHITREETLLQRANASW